MPEAASPPEVSGKIQRGTRLGAGTADSYSLWVNSGVLYAAIADNAGSGPFLSYPQSTQYCHVAYSFDAGTQVQALYVNGVLVDAGFVAKTIGYDTHPVLIGADDNAGSPGYFYKGLIDELTLYSRPLTGSEIQAIYAAGSGGKCQNATLVTVGTLASGAAVKISLVAEPTNCQPVSAAATVTSSAADPIPANNVATVTVPVQDLPASQD